jgi:hypothetical protein
MPEKDTAVIQAEALFPSGPWRGYFVYNARPGRWRMDLDLKFLNGMMTGSGSDAVGPFVIKGSYHTDVMEANWTKSYPTHDVNYRGFREGRGIWGTWTIRPDWHGGFMIWPKGMGELAQEKVYAEASEPDAIVVPGPGAQPVRAS